MSASQLTYLQRISDAELAGSAHRLRRIRAVARHDGEPGIVEAATAAIRRLETSAALAEADDRTTQQLIEEPAAPSTSRSREDR